MKKILLVSAFILSLTTFVKAQQIIHACCDTFICLPGSPVTLTVTIDSGSTGTVLNIADDTYSQLVTLGFNFKFFGNTYSKVVLSTNSYITFDQTLANAYSPWQITDASPSPVNPNNAIYGPWQDTDPSVNPFGTLAFGTFGTAPNRFFVYSWCSVPMYSSSPGSQCNDSLVTGQIVIYETSNLIEIHTGYKVACTFWNGGYAIMGLQDKTGANAVIVPGRNFPDLWTAQNEGKRFTPNGNSYDISDIPYAPVPFAAGTPQWYTLDGQDAGTGYAITVTPDVTTTYIVNTASCGFSADTITIVVGSFPVEFETVNLSCENSNDGSITATPDDATQQYDFVFVNSSGDTIHSSNNVLADAVSNLPAGTYTVIITNDLGCIVTKIITITTPIYNANFSYSPAIICEGQPVQFTDLSVGTVLSYAWTFGDGGSSTVKDPSYTYPGPGTYVVTLTIQVGPTCFDNFSQTIIVHPNFSAALDVSPPPYCVGVEIQFTDASIGAGAGFIWTFGDGASATTQDATHIYTNPGTYDVTFSVVDSFCGNGDDAITLVVNDIPHPALRTDTVLCKGEVIFLSSNVDGDSYLWSNGETTKDINFVMPGESGFVWVQVDNFGCTGVDSMYLINHCVVELPSAFSPNNDGANDLFHPLGSIVKDYELKVYNRWGQEVYTSNSGNQLSGWDGKLNGTDQPVGVYVYYYSGHFLSDDTFELKGNVTLVR
ncbi:MAG: PKD domain-containing protein [Chitinophagales bacterium]|nr:PKD domain-containing protein [Chitinophagales bacterium]